MWFRRLSALRMLALALVACGGLFLAPAVLVLLGADTAHAQGASDIFTVRRVPVDETAGTAAEARQVALAVGQRRAFRRLLRRLVPEDQLDLVPEPESSLLQYYVLDFSVANERASAVRYLADLTFRFNGEEVRKLLRNNNVGFAETRSKPVVVLPVFEGGGAAATLWQYPNPWRDVWASRPGDDGLVPLAVPLGDIGDVAAIDAARALGGDSDALREIAALYGAEDVLVSEAKLSGDPAAGSAALTVVTTRFRDGDRIGTLRDKLVQVSGEPYDGFLARAANRIDGSVQESWKQQNLLQFGSERSIVVYVPLDGLDDWLNVRRRLHGVAAIQQTGVNSLTRYEAQLEITFFGDEQRLSRALEQRDLFLALRPDSNWEMMLSEKRNRLPPEPALDGQSIFTTPAPQ
ncbi:DUF2066 domain-containing protein [Pelagibius sp. CAU 1746]|uniref:DUF2066 domain-containing protein n=1 Tax=Pelagibius sp. CAU 1746 TaxID=3140370 RepID=UPI00325AE077